MTKAKKHMLADLNKIITFYDSQVDWVGNRNRTIPVLFTKGALDKFATREAPDVERWKYRGYTLVRSAGAP